MKNLSSKLFAAVIAIVAVLSLFIAYGYKRGITGNSNTNPVDNYSSIGDLQRAVSFKFQIPPFISNKDKMACKDYLGKMVEIESDTYLFRAAPILDGTEDVMGVYEDCIKDIKYISIDESVHLRYRISEDNRTIVNLYTSEMSYGVIFCSSMSFESVLKNLGMKETDFVEENRETIAIDGSNDSSQEYSNESVQNSKEADYRLYNLSKLGVKFMLPIIESNLIISEDEKQAAIMIDNTIVFILEYYQNGYDTGKFLGITVKPIDKNYIVKYELDNDFDKASQEYFDYYTLIESIQVLIDTFNRI